jgi:membrane-associated protease RseP (regulator of RpoE activity)
MVSLSPSLVLAGLLAYWLALLAVRRAGLLPSYAIAQGPLLSLHTRRGRDFLDWLARPKRFWRAWANVGVGLTLVVMGLAFVFLLFTGVSRLYSTQSSPVTDPRNVLVIPGFNDFLPASVAPEILFGLLLGLVVHEGGHGLLCRVEDIDIESMGVLLLAVVPLGAFVEPDEESRRGASRGGQTRMFAAGVTNNFVVTVLAFGLLFGPVTASIAVAPGVAVGGTLDEAPDAISQGDRITGVGGTAVADAEELHAALIATDDDRVAVELNGEETVTVERDVWVTGVVSRGEANLTLGDRIVAVNDTAVDNRAELHAALENRSYATFEAQDGDTTTRPVGVLVAPTGGDPLANAGAPTDGDVYVTHVAGERVVAGADLTRALETTDPGERVEVRAVVDGSVETYDVRLGEYDDERDHGFLGVQAFPGVSGLRVDDFGVRDYPAATYLGVLGSGPGGGAGGFFGQLLLVLVLPVAGVSGLALPFNFAGFTGGVANFYVAAGPLGFLGGGLFVLANVLFWAGWVNFNLAFFNCIPGYPLDGGHILRNATEAVVSRLPVEDGRRATRAVTTTVGLTMLAALLAMLFGQGLLA